MKYINNVEDLDLEIKKVEERARISDDEMRLALSEFCYVTKRKLPMDPYSKEYFDAQINLYLEISGKSSYTVDNEYEDAHFDFEALKYNPYPYITKSATTVGDQLIAQGFLIKTMNLPAGAHILEFGPGWGNTTLHFVQTGYRVTAVEINQFFINLIKYRTEILSKEVRLIQQDMLTFSEQDSLKYDAALFFECFHHCADHLSLLRNLHKLISNDGLIAFAAEPIADFPQPWGVRLEGMSVWSIRKFGWLELGFNTSYFLRTLLLLGWTPKRYRSNDSPLCDVVIARKSNRYYEPSEITLPPDECNTWAPKEKDQSVKLRFTQTKSIMTCEGNINVSFIDFCISNYAPFAISVTLSAGSSSSTFRIPKSFSKMVCRLSVQDWNGKISISSKVWCPSKVFGNGDKRELGVALNYLHLIEA
jgi:2-polyprenyl-3-methyl-5-hydroxy-6-metoxy-1,4-benzoquinol methylase